MKKQDLLRGANHFNESALAKRYVFLLAACSAPAKRSGDGAFVRAGIFACAKAAEGCRSPKPDGMVGAP